MPLLFQYVPCARKGHTTIRPLSHRDEVWKGLMVTVSCIPQDMGVPDVSNTFYLVSKLLLAVPCLPQVPWPQRMLQLCQSCPECLGKSCCRVWEQLLWGERWPSHPYFLQRCLFIIQMLEIQNSFSYQKNLKEFAVLLMTWRIFKTLFPQNISQRFCYLHLGERHKDRSTNILFSSTCLVNRKIKAQVSVHQKVISVCHENNLHL